MFCMTGCSWIKTETVYVDVPYKVYPPNVFTILEPEPVLEGNTIQDLIDWTLSLKRSLRLANSKLASIEQWRIYDTKEVSNADSRAD